MFWCCDRVSLASQGCTILMVAISNAWKYTHLKWIIWNFVHPPLSRFEQKLKLYIFISKNHQKSREGRVDKLINDKHLRKMILHKIKENAIYIKIINVLRNIKSTYLQNFSSQLTQINSTVNKNFWSVKINSLLQAFEIIGEIQDFPKIMP